MGDKEHEKQRDPSPPKNPHDEDKDEDNDDGGGDKKTKNLLRYLEKKPMQEEQGSPLSKKEKSSSASGSDFGDKRNRDPDVDQDMGLGGSGAKYVGAKSNLWGDNYVYGSVASSGSGESLFGAEDLLSNVGKNAMQKEQGNPSSKKEKSSSASGPVPGDKRNRDSVQDDENGDGSRVTKNMSSVWGALDQFMRLSGSDAKYDAKSSLGSTASSMSSVAIGGFGSGEGDASQYGAFKSNAGVKIVGSGCGAKDGVMSNVSGQVGGASWSVSEIYRCTVCGKTFQNPRSLTSHIGFHARQGTMVEDDSIIRSMEALMGIKSLPANVESIQALWSDEPFLEDTGEALPEDNGGGDNEAGEDDEN